MKITLYHLNGNKRTCAECGVEEAELVGFTSESVGKRWRHLVLVLVCDGCGAKSHVRTGKVKDIKVV